jgi:hypothetical protein
MAKYGTVPIGELKTRLPAKCLSLVEECKEKLEKLAGDQGGRLPLEKGDDARSGNALRRRGCHQWPEVVCRMAGAGGGRGTTGGGLAEKSRAG